MGITAALKHAVARYGYVQGRILHPDQGSHFTSHLYRETLEVKGFRQSMGRTGSCYNNAIERLNREIRRRTHVVGAFPDGNSALRLVCARLRHVADTQWGNKKYMNMKHLETICDDARKISRPVYG